MDKEGLRKLFGKPGDFNPAAATIFGSAYLDSPDVTGENIDPTLKKIAGSSGLVCNEVSGLVTKALENAPTISCEENQLINARFIRGFITNTVEGITHEQLWSTFKHIDSCQNADCHLLHNISTWDNILTPEEMNRRFGKHVISWFEKHSETSK
ncbi:MAG: hypothetical protein ABIJ05_02780 [Patescibacteria group bacterium]